MTVRTYRFRRESAQLSIKYLHFEVCVVKFDGHVLQKCKDWKIMCPHL